MPESLLRDTLLPRKRRSGAFALRVAVPAGSQSATQQYIFPLRSILKMRTATLDAAAAVNLLKHARSVCDQLNPLGTPMTMAELQQRAQIVDSVIRARAKLQLLRNRAIELENAVERFKARKAGKAA